MMELDEKRKKTDKAISITYDVLERNKEKNGVKKAFEHMEKLRAERNNK